MTFTKEDCIAELLRLSAPFDEPITRNFFRENSMLCDSDWQKYFINFKNFRAAAGLGDSRHASKMVSQAATHASKDNLVKVNAERMEWATRYQRPSGKRFETILVGSDIHDIHCDPFWRRLFLDTAKRVQPAKIVINGDLYDLPEFSKHTQDPREYRMVERVKWVTAFLKELREACPTAEITLVEGNHEARMIRHLSDDSPSMRTILADLHGWGVKDVLGLGELQINYAASADLRAFTYRWSETISCTTSAV